MNGSFGQNVVSSKLNFPLPEIQPKENHRETSLQSGDIAFKSSFSELLKDLTADNTRGSENNFSSLTESPASYQETRPSTENDAGQTQPDAIERSSRNNHTEENDKAEEKKEVKSDDAIKDKSTEEETKEELEEASRLIEQLESAGLQDQKKITDRLKKLLGSLETKIDSLMEKGVSKENKLALLQIKGKLNKLSKLLAKTAETPLLAHEKNELITSAKNLIAEINEKTLNRYEKGEHNRLHAHKETPKEINADTHNATVTGNAVSEEQKSSTNSSDMSENRQGFSFKGQSDENMRLESGKDAAAKSAQAKSSVFKEQINDIINRSRVVISDKKNGHLNLKLYPEKLGHVNIHLGLENGTLTGKFTVESHEAKEVLLSQMDELMEQLEKEGMELGSFEVNVREQQQKFGQNKWKQEVPTYFHEGSRLEENAALEYNSTQHSLHDGNINLVV